MDDLTKKLVRRAYDKMVLEQERDPCCVWTEFEGLILELHAQVEDEDKEMEKYIKWRTDLRQTC